MLGSDHTPQARTEVRASLANLIAASHERMASARNEGTRGWRRLYTDASILLAYADALDFSSSPPRDDALALSAIARLDHAIVIAGAPGDGRLDCILDLIERLQSACLHTPSSSSARTHGPFQVAEEAHAGDTDAHPPESFAPPGLSSSSLPVPRLSAPPSLASFSARHSKRPFVLPGFLLDWPALGEHPWRSLAYLRAVAGPGRVVPVEVGSDYRQDDWTQKMMPWDAFLASLADGGAPPANHDGEGPPAGRDGQVLYLAQHSLFNQFPALRDDVIVPDYVYADLDPPDDYPGYAPPANDERLVLNAWLGPAGTVSPAHTVRRAGNVCAAARR